jgi:uncharacterized protein
MLTAGWTDPESPFHSGELAIQTRLGVRERMDKQGRRIIRNYLTEQHQQFFAQLPYIITGTVDSEGHPWASILVGEPGFLSSPDANTLRVTAQPIPGDPLATHLQPGIDIGLLGIELHSRRRNRLNGVVSATDANGFDVQVRQSFGNCPQYIQARQLEISEEQPQPARIVHSFSVLQATEQSMIAAADTFFIATAYQDATAGASSGVDVSHRGGKPGFVRLDDAQTLTIPDFSGNNHYNTFGNLELNPQAGLLFLDFNQGDLLYVTGTAKVIWEGAEIASYAGAERLLHFHLNQGYRLEKALPLSWSVPEFSPFLAPMGSW